MKSQRQQIINQLLNDYSRPYNRELEILRRIDETKKDIAPKKHFKKTT